MDWKVHFTNLKPVPKFSFGSDLGSASFGAVFSQTADNLVALNDYMHRTPAKTADAKELAHDWVEWWVETGDPGNYWLSVPDAVWDEARNRRLAFDLANATTQTQVNQVQQVATTGMTSEEAQGLPERRDPTTGEYYTPSSTLPKWLQFTLAGALAGIVLPAALPAFLKSYNRK